MTNWAWSSFQLLLLQDDQAVIDHPEMQDLVHKYEASAVILGSALGARHLQFTGIVLEFEAPLCMEATHASSSQRREFHAQAGKNH